MHLSEEDLRDYLDGDLTEGKRADIDAHLEICGECVERAQEIINELGPIVSSIAPDAVVQPNAGETAPSAPAPALRISLPEGPGAIIGPYKLLQKIGEGGMGVVFMAEQETPVRRRVALKVMRPGMDSEQVIARFEAERQALALMDHQNIAKVLEAGATSTGRPYFVMELVRGVPITQYCDRNRLTPRERLELFISVCRAIQHAHQKGIIHRDIKPSNVLVSIDDGKPQAKVIDFGVAKAIDQRLTERTLFTTFGQVVGTLEYMSPEQAEPSALDIDTRSDIFSLGVLLYELLTGTTPLESVRVRKAAYLEILKRIREEETPRPSDRLSEQNENLATISAQRKSEPARLAMLVRGELDWIVMKALEKDRTRRYETASGFARDIERFLDGDPVEAGPPGAAYRLRKMVRKHRVALATAAAFAALLVCGAVVSFVLFIRARNAEAAATHALGEVKLEKANTAAALVREQEAHKKTGDALAAEQKATAAASRAAAESRAVLDFLEHRLLSAARPKGLYGGIDKDVTLLAAIDAAEPQIKDDFKNQPGVEASIRNALGLTYWYLGKWARAIPQLDRAVKLRTAALGRDHPETLMSRNNLGLAYQDAGQIEAAISLFEPALEAYRKLGTQALPDALACQQNLAQAYANARRVGQAISMFEQTLEACRQIPNPSPSVVSLTLHCENNLGRAKIAAGKPDAAIPILRETLEGLKKTGGPDYLETILCTANLGEAHLRAGDLAGAIPLLEACEQSLITKLGPSDDRALNNLISLATAYARAGKLDEAARRFKDLVNVLTQVHGADHAATVACQADLANVYQMKQDYPGCEREVRHYVNALRRKAGESDQEALARALSWLGWVLLKQEKWVDAEPPLRESTRIHEEKFPQSWSRSLAESLLGGSLLGQRKFGAAEALILKGYNGLKVCEASIPESAKGNLREAADRIISLYEAWEKPEKLAKWRQRLGKEKARQ